MAATPRPVALQMYTLRHEIEQDAAGVLRRVAEMGYAGLEPFAVATYGARRLRDMAMDLGLELPSAHMPLPTGAGAGQVLDDLATLGTDTMFVSCSREQFASREGIVEAGEALAGAAISARARGVSVGYHNHWWEFANHVDGRPAYDYFLEVVGEPVPLEVDTYWVQAGGADPAEVVARFGDRVTHLHVKDGPAVPGEPQVAVGKGSIDIAAVLGANEAVRWHVVELDSCDSGTEEAVRESYRFLVGNGLSIGRQPVER
ncbi:MAG: sugar phosphate isomerase/epimerase family protein [Acidimicrobiales bacterium]